MIQVGWKFVSLPNCWYGCVHAKVDDIDIDINIDGMVHLIKMRFFSPFLSIHIIKWVLPAWLLGFASASFMNANGIGTKLKI